MSTVSGVKRVRSRSDIAKQMFKKARMALAARPRIRSAKPGNFEGVRFGVATSGSSSPEKKVVDIQVGSTSVVTGTPYILSMLAGIAEGTALAQRVGAKILLKSLDIEMNIIGNPGANVGLNGYAATPIDIFIVWDKQPDGATPTVGSILVSSTTNLSFGNTTNLDRFVVLRRKTVNLDWVSNMGETWREHVPLELASRFGDATASPQTNDIYVMAVSPIAASATTINALISYVARVKFTDA